MLVHANTIHTYIYLDYEHGISREPNTFQRQRVLRFEVQSAKEQFGAPMTRLLLKDWSAANLKRLPRRYPSLLNIGLLYIWIITIVFILNCKPKKEKEQRINEDLDQVSAKTNQNNPFPRMLTEVQVGCWAKMGWVRRKSLCRRWVKPHGRTPGLLIGEYHSSSIISQMGTTPTYPLVI